MTLPIHDDGCIVANIPNYTMHFDGVMAVHQENARPGMNGG